MHFPPARAARLVSHGDLLAISDRRTKHACIALRQRNAFNRSVLPLAPIKDEAGSVNCPRAPRLCIGALAGGEGLGRKAVGPAESIPVIDVERRSARSPSTVVGLP
jgi:hypothetical protein